MDELWDSEQVPALSLRPITVDDTPRIHQWTSDERGCRYQTWGPNTLPETEAFVVAAVDAWTDESAARRVWVAIDPGLGVVGIGELKRRTNSCLEIAYAVHVDLWGRGLGTEIALLLLDVAFADTTTERVHATCDPRNLGSAAILAHIGMTMEGTLRHTMLLRDGWRDSRMFSLLSSEWQASRGAEAGPGD